MGRFTAHGEGLCEGGEKVQFAAYQEDGTIVVQTHDNRFVEVPAANVYIDENGEVSWEDYFSAFGD